MINLTITRLVGLFFSFWGLQMKKDAIWFIHPATGIMGILTMNRYGRINPYWKIWWPSSKTGKQCMFWSFPCFFMFLHFSMFPALNIIIRLWESSIWRGKLSSNYQLTGMVKLFGANFSFMWCYYTRHWQNSGPLSLERWRQRGLVENPIPLGRGPRNFYGLFSCEAFHQ